MIPKTVKISYGIAVCLIVIGVVLGVYTVSLWDYYGVSEILPGMEYQTPEGYTPEQKQIMHESMETFISPYRDIGIWIVAIGVAFVFVPTIAHFVAKEVAKQ